MDMYDTQSILRNLDKQSTGYVNWRQLITYIILLTSPIMSQQDAKDLLKASENDNGTFTRETFSKLPMWFDEVEVSKDRDYSIPFERCRMIKELLFDVHCTTVDGKDEPVLVAEGLIEILRLPAKQIPHKEHMEYNDFLLAPVKTCQM